MTYTNDHDEAVVERKVSETKWVEVNRFTGLTARSDALADARHRVATANRAIRSVTYRARVVTTLGTFTNEE